MIKASLGASLGASGQSFYEVPDIKNKKVNMVVLFP
jgi:hypothetical protein